jgi:hypothetical protein
MTKRSKIHRSVGAGDGPQSSQLDVIGTHSRSKREGLSRRTETPRGGAGMALLALVSSSTSIGYEHVGGAIG